MTQEDIIKLAREAGLYVGRNISGVQLVGSSYEEGGLLVHLTVEEFERFAALVAEHEREQCALIAAHILKMPQNDVSTLIRARGMRHE